MALCLLYHEVDFLTEKGKHKTEPLLHPMNHDCLSKIRKIIYKLNILRKKGVKKICVIVNFVKFSI